MKLATYAFEDGAGPARVADDEATVVDLRGLAPSVRALLEADALAVAAAHAGPVHPLDRACLLAPVPDARAFLGVGLNYRDHAAEVGRALPDVPPVFAKLPAALNGPHGDVPLSRHSDTLDYEGELGVVIGRRVHDASEADARGAVAGYVVVNDVTVRALARPDTLVLGKSGAGHAPFGPWITAADAVPDPHALRLRTWIDGELRQDSTTAQLHHGVFALVSFISRALVLQPGDVIATGSPAGSGVGLRPPRYLRAGQVVRVAIEGLGHIENRIVPPLPA